MNELNLGRALNDTEQYIVNARVLAGKQEPIVRRVINQLCSVLSFVMQENTQYRKKLRTANEEIDTLKSQLEQTERWRLEDRDLFIQLRRAETTCSLRERMQAILDEV
jgi:hypothetical protein